MPDLSERPEEGLFLLPGGYLDPDGNLQREGVLRPLTGREEEAAADPARGWTEATLVTALLGRCVTRIGPYRPTEPLLRSLAVGDRDYLMLRLRQITFGPRVEMTLVCPRPLCAKKMDADLDLAQISVAPRPMAPHHTLTLSEAGAILDEQGRFQREVVFRIPNGEDQEAVRGWEMLDERERVVRLLSRCLASPPDAVRRWSTRSVEEITAAMEQQSPQVEIDMELHCPECGGHFIHPFEIVPFFIKELLRDRGQFEREVHLLAFYYHWPLREILGLTRQKRRRYLELLTDELERSGRSILGRV
ncbi:MAG: hypothetical protein HY282_09460 [Nitrospirae bacterium]|nr:hypothetical protein [Candidatus Manganitrophaceae bacterium]